MKRIDNFLMITYGAVIIALVMLLSSCSPQMRMQTLIKKHPELLNSTYDTSTIHIKDSVVLNIESFDTTFVYKDSILFKDSIATTVLYKYSNGTERIITKYKPVVIPFDKIIKVPTVKYTTLKVGATKEEIKKYKKEGRNQGRWEVVLVLFSIIVLIVAIYILAKYFKPLKLI